MARLARVVAPGLPHHVTQRGNRRQQTFFCDEDYQIYPELMAEDFLATLEQDLGRILRRQKPGPKRRLPSHRTRGRKPAS